MTVARVAGAPISWGVCEVLGWGHQLSAGRVLSEMRAVGLHATEFGPPGFLETRPEALAAQLAGYGLQGVGGFLTVVAHEREHDPLPEVDSFIDSCVAAGAGVVVLATVTGLRGLRHPPRPRRPRLEDPAHQPRPHRRGSPGTGVSWSPSTPTSGR